MITMPEARVVVGIGEMKVSADPLETLVTYALGSCLGVVVYDPVAKVGGMLHAMLPQASLDRRRAGAEPARFVDAGVPALFRACYDLGASKQRLRLSVAGGASVQGQETDQFQIGKRNLLMLRQLLWKNGVLIQAQDVGGHSSRTLSLSLETGMVMVRSQGADTLLS